MAIQVSEFGRTPEGQVVHAYLLRAGGFTARLITYGARVTELHVPDRAGVAANIVLGFDRLEPYLNDSAYLGCTVGRYANRIGGARFTLDTVEYALIANETTNTLHGGPRGFDKAVWAAEEAGDAAVRFAHTSPHGDQGFPGTLTAQVTYALTPDGALQIDFEASSDAPTPVNLTNHSYFNLRGAGVGDVLDHVLELCASRYTPTDSALIPTGQILPVAGTPLDFTAPQRIGERIRELPAGYDHNFVIDTGGGALAQAARVLEPSSGRVMEVLTTQPGIQLYTGNFLDGSIRGLGGTYAKHGGLCLETQHFPDSPNRNEFPSTILRPTQVYRHQAEYRFAAQ